MTKNFKIFFFAAFVALSIVSCGSGSSEEIDPAANSSTGSISAKFNGTAWSGAWATGLIATLGGTKVLTITGKISEQNSSESVLISINNFAGVGTYNFDGASGGSKITISYAGKGYVSTPIAGGGGGGTGTIKITEYVAANGVSNPGKAVGEFSGTIKSYNTTEQVTVTTGKFTAIIVM